MIQGREVPTSAAEGFLRGVDQDPKFQRFHERLDCLARAREVAVGRDVELGKLRAERRELSTPPTRTLAVGMVLALPLVALAAALPWWQARVAELALVFVALVADEVRHRAVAAKRAARLAEVADELERVESEAKIVVEQLEARVAEIDREMASSIKIIDPDTFGKTKKEEEKRSS